MHRPGPVLRWMTSIVVGVLIATLLLLVGQPARTGQVTPVAGKTNLCSGYSGCARAGYSDAGYAAVNHKMYWRMYSGHNCTNYAAYRVIKNGGPASRPWSGGGNASEWGLRMKNITDQVPAVGAIAWWGRYDNGSGSAGHVAYVERVVSPTQIVVSEDSWGGTFHWSTITKSGGRWPTGFIHFTDKQVKVVTAPKVVGTPAVGARLHMDLGTWTPTVARAVQWLADGQPIAGQNAFSYYPTADVQGKRISARVTGNRVGYNPTTVTTAPSATVAQGTFADVQPPVLSGEPIVGQVLTSSPATWQPNVAQEWWWYADGVWLSKEHGPTLTLTPDLVGKKITSLAVARKAGYAPKLTFAKGAIGPIMSGKITQSTAPRVTGVPRVGQVLRATPGTYAPADAQAALQWLRNGHPIPGATGAAYRVSGADAGARISLRTRVTRAQYQPFEQTTAVPGVVTSTTRMSLFAAGQRRQAVVQVYVAGTGFRATGQVLVAYRNRLVRANLVNGIARVVFKRAGPGKVEVKVRYLGSSALAPTYGSKWIRVTR